MIIKLLFGIILDKIYRLIKEKNIPDFIISINFPYILNEKILNLPKYDALNIHGSLLPKYRGGSPVVWAIINGETKCGNLSS